MRIDNPNVQFYLQEAIAKLIKHNVAVRLVNKRTVDGYGGHFCGETPEFAVATRTSNIKWFTVFIHEYCHFLQYLDEDSIWYDEPDHVSAFFNWLDKESEKITPENVFGAQMLELDCEKRVIDLIDEYELPVNKTWYIKTANSYLFSYNTTYKLRKWPNKVSQYRVKQIFNSMPDYFLDPEEYKKPPKNYHELSKKHCYK